MRSRSGCPIIAKRQAEPDAYCRQAVRDLSSCARLVREGADLQVLEQPLSVQQLPDGVARSEAGRTRERGVWATQSPLNTPVLPVTFGILGPEFPVAFHDRLVRSPEASFRSKEEVVRGRC